MKTQLTLLTSIVLSANVFAAAQVDYLNVDGDAVYFSTNETKVQTPPQCAVAETNDKFAVSLNTEAGRAMYSLLITAMSTDQGVSVKTAGDCEDVAGVERAEGVSIVPAASSLGTESFYLYKSDGVTRLGKIADTENGGIRVVYLSPSDNSKFQYYDWSADFNSVYFAENDCLGTAYLTTANYIFHNKSYQGNKYFKTSSAQTLMTKKSVLNNKGECTNASWPSAYTYQAEPYEHPVCGESLCIIKEE